MADTMRNAAAPFALLALAVALRCHDYGNPVVHVDEQYYLLVGDRLAHGALPYVDIWDRKPIGLFAIFAAIRWLPGDGILAYQLVATLFAAATACLVRTAARMIGATPVGATVAGAAYLIWLPLFSGQAGQSPVFYNLFVTVAAVLTLRLPALADERAAILRNGAATCLLAGLAIQTKYTPAVEGAFFGLAHLWYLRGAGARPALLVGAALLWIALGVAPTAVVVAVYAAHGRAAFAAFWFANFTSILLRTGYSYPPALIAGRLVGTAAKLALLAIAAVIAWRREPRTPALALATGWVVAALLGYAVLGTYFDHYALPLIAPFAILAAPTFARYPRIALATLGAGLTLALVFATDHPDDGPATRTLARYVAAHSGRDCPYVFIGDSIVYHLAHACLPTAYAFPSTLAYAPERGATGIDEAAEVARIMARRPPVIVITDRPLAPWNPRSHAVMRRALARDYRIGLIVPRDDYHAIAYVRTR
jgi:hypothetical protein